MRRYEKRAPPTPRHVFGEGRCLSKKIKLASSRIKKVEVSS